MMQANIIVRVSYDCAMYIQILDLVIYYSDSIFSDDPAYGENKNSRMVQLQFFYSLIPRFQPFYSENFGPVPWNSLQQG